MGRADQIRRVAGGLSPQQARHKRPRGPWKPKTDRTMRIFCMGESAASALSKRDPDVPKTPCCANQDQSRSKRCRAVRYRNLSRSEEYRYA